MRHCYYAAAFYADDFAMLISLPDYFDDARLPPFSPPLMPIAD
jgi:hypothetical protein